MEVPMTTTIDVDEMVGSFFFLLFLSRLKKVNYVGICYFSMDKYLRWRSHARRK